MILSRLIVALAVLFVVAPAHAIYNADLGRWMTRDPLGVGEGASQYRYALANPLTFADPSGLKIRGEGCSGLLKGDCGRYMTAFAWWSDTPCPYGRGAFVQAVTLELDCLTCECLGYAEEAPPFTFYELFLATREGKVDKSPIDRVVFDGVQNAIGAQTAKREIRYFCLGELVPWSLQQHMSAEFLAVILGFNPPATLEYPTSCPVRDPDSIGVGWHRKSPPWFWDDFFDGPSSASTGSAWGCCSTGRSSDSWCFQSG